MNAKDRMTPKQDAFAFHLALGASQAEAYRQAGFKANGDAVYVGAAKLAAQGKVRAKVAELKGKVEASRFRALQAGFIATAQSVTSLLADTYAAATADKQHGAAATAAMGIAKLHGLLVERHEDITRRATRDPAAPKEISVEHWVTEQKAALSPVVDDMGLASPAVPALEPHVLEPQPGHADGLPEPRRSDAGLDIVMVHSDINVGPDPEITPAAEEDNPQGSGAPSPEGAGWRKIN